MIRARLVPWLRDPHVQIYLWDLIRLCALPNYWVARWRWRGRAGGGGVRLHLGSGERYVEGWVNVDGKPLLVRKDLWLYLRNGLPFPDETVTLIYSSHALEHLFLPELRKVIRECRRVLLPGGVMRVCVPSLERPIAAHLQEDHAFFDRVVYREGKVRGWRSLGAKLSEALLYDGAHKLALDFGFLAELMEEAGFARVTQHEFRESPGLDPADLSRLEGEQHREVSLFVEGVRA